MVANEGQKWLTSGQSWLIVLFLLENVVLKMGAWEWCFTYLFLAKCKWLSWQFRWWAKMRYLSTHWPSILKFSGSPAPIVVAWVSQSVSSLVSSPLTASVALAGGSDRPFSNPTSRSGPWSSVQVELRTENCKLHTSPSKAAGINGGWRMLVHTRWLQQRSTNIHHQSKCLVNVGELKLVTFIDPWETKILHQSNGLVNVLVCCLWLFDRTAG